MTEEQAASLDWSDAFPLRGAADAAEALCKSWKFLVTKSRAFHPKMTEPQLTKALKIHVEQVTAPEAGLLGMWTAENVIGTINLDSGAITEERRTDIAYGWNDARRSIQVVFEFKKLTRYAKARKAYIGQEGLGRFVTGIYSKAQPVAAMVGMLIHPHAQTVPPLVNALEDEGTIAALHCVVGSSGKACQTPSAIFKQAEFDTTHQRPSKLAPTSGVIRVAHLFLAFE